LRVQNRPKICACGAFHFNLLQNPLNPNFCRGDCSHVLTACIQTTSLKQGCAGGALAGCYEPTCQKLLFSWIMCLRHEPQIPHNAKNYRYEVCLRHEPQTNNPKQKCAYIMHSRKEISHPGHCTSHGAKAKCVNDGEIPKF